VLPEFADIKVLEGFDGTTPKMRAPKVKATARHLATHTSGLEYEFWRAETAEYLTKTGRPSVLAGTKAALFYPMITDPDSTLHAQVMGKLGMTLGEFFDFEALAADCADDGVYEFFFSAAPLAVPGGIGSPPSAVVIK